MSRFTHRLHVPIVVLLALVLILSACGTPPIEQPQAGASTAPSGSTAPAASVASSERSKTVIFDIDGGRVADPTAWNPFVPQSRVDQGFHQAMIEPLFILNYESGEIEPWLGESMSSNQELDLWTLKLRDGIKWSDGQPFTSDDVVFTIQMLLSNTEKTLNNAAAMQQWVKSVNAVDPRTVEFTLNNANPRFQLDYFSVKIFGSIPIVPKHVWEGQDPLTFKNYDPAKGWPVFTGPYKLKSANETEFVYTRDPNWWGASANFKPLPKPEQLVWTWGGPEETRTALMADDKLDSLMDITLGAFQALQQKNTNVIAWKTELPYTWLDPCSRTLEFNDSVAPWSDKNLRWAVNYAIDRDQIVKIAYEGTTIPSRHFFPAYPPLNKYVDQLEQKGLYTKYPITTHDPAKATQLIEAAGYTKNGDYYEKDGKQLSLDIQTHEAFIEKQRIAQVIVEELQAIGINASTRNVAGATWEQNYQTGNFEAKMGWQTCGSINEPWASMDTFNASWIKPIGERADNNGWRWKNDEYSKLVDQIGTLPLGDPKIDGLFEQAMTIWMDELPVIPITQAKKLIPFDTTYWKGWPDSKNNYLHATTWWQSTHKIIHNLQPTGK